MIPPIPKSLAVDLSDEMDMAIKETPRHLVPTDLLIVDLDERLRKLESAIPATGALLRSSWFALQGDVVGMEGSIATARKAGAATEAILIYQTVGYTNLGYGTKGLGAFRRAIDVSNFNVTVGIRCGVACGAFQRIEELVRQAEAAQLDMTPLADLAGWTQARTALAHQGISDDDCARVVDLAGVVLRSRNLFWLDLSPKVLSHGLDDPVILLMRVDRTATEASQMSLEFVDELIDAGAAQSPFLVTFVGTRP